MECSLHDMILESTSNLKKNIKLFLGSKQASKCSELLSWTIFHQRGSIINSQLRSTIQIYFNLMKNFYEDQKSDWRSDLKFKNAWRVCKLQWARWTNGPSDKQMHSVVSGSPKIQLEFRGSSVWRNTKVLPYVGILWRLLKCFKCVLIGHQLRKEPLGWRRLFFGL